MTFRQFVFLGMLILVSVSGANDLARAEQRHPTEATSAKRALLHDMCGKQVVLLGESPTHSLGKAMQLKVELVEELVDNCQFNAVFFESGLYDFLHIQNELASGHDVTEGVIAAAVGGLWDNADVAPLLPYLTQRLRTHKIIVGGIDDQIGRGSYAQRSLPADLTRALTGDTRTRCFAAFERHTLWQYTNESPYSPSDKSVMVNCLEAIQAKLSSASPMQSHANASDVAIIESLKRMLSRDFMENAHAAIDPNSQAFNMRDESMYRNFTWLTEHLPKNSKVIVWSATPHISRDLQSIPGREEWSSFGSRVVRERGGNCFALAISAYAGTYAFRRQPAKPLSAAPDGSLEAQAFANSDAESRYLNRKDLHNLGVVPGRALGTNFIPAAWDVLFDGMFVFREERPPQPSGE